MCSFYLISAVGVPGPEQWPEKKHVPSLSPTCEWGWFSRTGSLLPGPVPRGPAPDSGSRRHGYGSAASFPASPSGGRKWPSLAEGSGPGARNPSLAEEWNPTLRGEEPLLPQGPWGPQLPHGCGGLGARGEGARAPTSLRPGGCLLFRKTLQVTLWSPRSPPQRQPLVS